MAAELNDPLELDDAPSDQPTAASAKSSVDDNKVEPRVPGKSARWAIDCQDDDDEGFDAWGSSDWRALLGDGKANAEDGQNKIEADLADARQSVVDALAAKTEPPVEPKAAPAVSTAMWWVTCDHCCRLREMPQDRTPNEGWVCTMNDHDERYASCTLEQDPKAPKYMWG